VTGVSPLLTQEQHAALLAEARRAIRDRVRGAETAASSPEDPALRALGAAFVTITYEGGLRGCIGYVEPVKPLAEAVSHCAASAAVADPRFPPVTLDELPHLRVEVSVLSPLRLVADPDEIQVGTHGLFISHAGRHGLLLPQVATEFGWDRETFLRQTCLKAGLPGEAWKGGAEIRIFTVDHFTDDTPVGLQER
jgi:AmmeMemoRadiSam system protein A